RRPGERERCASVHAMSRPWWGVAAVAIILLAVAGAAAPADAPRLGPLSRGDRDFLIQHWRAPLAPPGQAPERFTAVERSLAPADCGACHPTQFADWRDSVHAKSMGPGIAGQLVEMSRGDPAFARSCLACHAPLAEQAAEIRSGAGFAPNPVFD